MCSLIWKKIKLTIRQTGSYCQLFYFLRLSCQMTPALFLSRDLNCIEASLPTGSRRTFHLWVRPSSHSHADRKDRKRPCSKCSFSKLCSVRGMLLLAQVSYDFWSELWNNAGSSSIYGLVDTGRFCRPRQNKHRFTKYSTLTAKAF